VCILSSSRFRADYGKQVIAALARQLPANPGKGWSERQLRYFVPVAEAARRCSCTLTSCAAALKGQDTALPFPTSPPANHPRPPLPPRIPKVANIAFREPPLNVTQEVLRVLDEVLSLNGRSAAFTRDTPLLGAIPELDSMAVVSLITSMEDQFGLVVDDDDIDGATFATVGSLVDFVSGKMAG